MGVVRGFASVDECDYLIREGGAFEDMEQAFEGSGQTSYRRSYSSNIEVNHEDFGSTLTLFSERQFALVRNFTGYDVHGPGQEPINAVLYKNAGDEYRPHCDGECDGGAYERGKRVATSILY